MNASHSSSSRVSLSPDACNRVGVAISMWLLLEGVWGLFSSEVFGVFDTNRLHATIHLALAVVGLWASFTGRAAKFLWGLGLLLLAVGVLFFVPGGRELTDILNVNEPVAVFNIILGAFSIGWAIHCSRN